MKSNLYKIYCRQCHRENDVNLVCNQHTAGKVIMNCPFCGSKNIKVTQVNMPSGGILGRFRIFARDERMNKYGQIR